MVGWRERKDSPEGMCAWPLNQVFFRGTEKTSGELFCLGSFQNSAISKMFSSLLKESSGFREEAKRQYPPPWPWAGCYVPPPFQLGDSSAVNLRRKRRKGFVSVSVLLLLSPALASIRFPPLCCPVCGRRHLPGRLLLR